MDTINIYVKDRQINKKSINSIRKAATLIPAVVYGNVKENKHITVDYNTFIKAFKIAGTNTIVNLIDEKNLKIPSIVRSIDINPVTNKIMHVDFFAVKMDSEIDTTVNITVIGESDAIKIDKGILIHNLEKINIRCMPKDLIHAIEVDISDIKEVGTYIYVKDLKVPPKIKILDDPEEIVLSIIAQEQEAEETEGQATTEENASTTGEQTEENKSK